MFIVGIDFGTTNMRISTWDNDGFPQSCKIGKDKANDEIMPAVAALRQQNGDSIKVFVGEDAYAEAGSPGTSKVIHRIKRCVLAQDSYIEARMKDEARMEDDDTSCLPHRWNEQQQCTEVQVEIEGQEVWFSAREIISQILKEAISRAGLPDEFEWRAGCPVHADLRYRSMLKDLLPNPGRKSSLNWVVEEPILVLAAAQRHINANFNQLQGSYLVYDLGGGSFDCAVVQISRGGYIVYSADGIPNFGAEDIHSGRLEKKVVLRRSLMSLRDAYTKAKVVWARGENDYPFGETISENDDTGEVRFVWQLDYRTDMPRDVDGIIVYGGITKDDKDFEKYLGSWFGEDKIISIGDLLGVGGRRDPELLALSWGACYFYDRQNSHYATVPIRLPIHATLENLITGEKVKYEPYQHFSPAGDVWGAYRSTLLRQERDNPSEYEITITDPDGVVLKDENDRDFRLTFGGFMEPRKLLEEEGNRQPATSLQLIIDRLGYVWVQMRSEGVGLPWTKTFRFPDVQRDPDDLPPSPPWQTEAQREAWKRIQEKIKQQEEKRRLKLVNTLNRPAHLEVN